MKKILDINVDVIIINSIVMCTTYHGPGCEYMVIIMDLKSITLDFSKQVNHLNL